MNFNVFVFAVLFWTVVFSSCSKSDNPTPKPATPVIMDTLGAGWTKVNGAGGFDIFFANNNIGYTCGGSLHKSVNGGLTWSFTSLLGNFRNCFVTADNKAFFAIDGSPVIKTLDGGSTFITIPALEHVTDFFFLDNNTGFAISTFSVLYQTVDGGVNWTPVPATGFEVSDAYASLTFASAAKGWIVSDSGLYRSTTTINTWVPSIINGGAYRNFSSIYSISPTIIFASNSKGEIYKSTDGGINFNYQITLPTANFTDLHFINDQVGYASNGHYLFKTVNGGNTWIKELTTSFIICEIHFTDATHGWACGIHNILIFKP